MNSYDDEWDFDNGEVAVWSAEWFGPEEKIEDEEALNTTVYVHVKYRGEREFRWYYFQIKSAVEDIGVESFIKEQGITDASSDDVQELTDFLKHWLMFVDCEIDLTQTLEVDDVNEELGADDFNRIQEEMGEAGIKETAIASAVRKTLH